MIEEKYILLLNNGKYAELKKFNERIFDVFEVERFSNATLLSEEEADFALEQQHTVAEDFTSISYDFGESDLSFLKKEKVILQLKK